ncbi:hypothetical protein [Shouchella shacheensis]|uniref:hypothetical protein n=1 Tax=Shouchella shacheensis TaxID=1649580 RepID=UPI00073FDC8B|nr:hypothetical protein [Shouchella shacheensis]
MKKHATFLGSFLVVYIGLQILSGMVLTMFYSAEIIHSLGSTPSTASEVAFGEVSFIRGAGMVVVAAVIAFLITKVCHRPKTQTHA